MTNLRWKIVTVLAVFILFFSVGPYPIVAARYHLPIPSWLQEKQLKEKLQPKKRVIRSAIYRLVSSPHS